MNLDFFEQQSFSCPECQGPMERTHGTMRFEDDEIAIVIEHVPVLKCTACGHEYVPGPVARELSVLINDVAADMRRAPIQNTAIRTDYKGVQHKGKAASVAYAD